MHTQNIFGKKNADETTHVRYKGLVKFSGGILVQNQLKNRILSSIGAKRGMLHAVWRAIPFLTKCKQF